jgi:metal-sulfur cluster biosynthetic enzyme
VSAVGVSAVAPASVLDALAGVFDPELDEPITELGFVSLCEVSAGGDVRVHLRLPTPQCAPNFAFLMAADARRVVSALPGVRVVRVVLEDHYTGGEINAAVARGEGFTVAFPGETADDDLEALRELFLRKALVARQGRVCERLLALGVSRERLVAMRVSELPDDGEARRCLELRERLGIEAGPGAAALVTGDGLGICAEGVERWLRMARLVATSLEANGGICRSLLAFRHRRSDQPDQEVVG